MSEKELIEADEVTLIDIRERAARLCQVADTETVLKPAREIIILCERALARRIPPEPESSQLGSGFLS